MCTRHAGLTLLFAIALLSFAAASAPAATTIGSDLSHAPNVVDCPGKAPAFNSCSYANASLTTPSPGGATSPVDGVVVRWRIRASGSPATTFLMANLHTMSGNASRARTSSALLPLVDTVTVHDTRLTIAAGDRIGVTITGLASDPFVIGLIMYGSASPSPGSTDRFPKPLSEDGAQTPTVLTNFETLLNADIEADIDHDGFGDETQDQCPGSAQSQLPCPAPSITNARFKSGDGFKFDLSEKASVDLSVMRILPGRVAKTGKCLTGVKRGKRCSISKSLPTLSNLAAAAGPTTVPYASRRLVKGNYFATITATTIFNQTSSATFAFKVKRRAK